MDGEIPNFFEIIHDQETLDSMISDGKIVVFVGDSYDADTSRALDSIEELYEDPSSPGFRTTWLYVDSDTDLNFGEDIEVIETPTVLAYFDGELQGIIYGSAHVDEYHTLLESLR